MPFNGSNTFTIINTFVPGTTILSSAVNANFSDIATGLSDCVTRDAQGAVTGNLLFSSTGFLGLPAGTTAQRPAAPAASYFRYNSTILAPEFYDGTIWNSLSPTVQQPQGYLTLTNLASGGPITSADAASVTSVFYSPAIGQLCPVYNGTSFINQVFTEQTLTLASQHVANSIYDVFAFLASNVFTIGTGPAWSTITPGSCARGTGAGTTQLQRLNGILTNQNSMTARNGTTTYTVAANQGTYLGSIHIDTTAGQVSCLVSFGQNRKWGVWNAYNRVPIRLLCGDSTVSWVYSTSAFRASNNVPAAYSASAFNYPVGTACNGGVVLMGLPEEPVNMRFIQHVHCNVNGTSITPQNAIGINSITSVSGKTGFGGGSQAAAGTFENDLAAEYFLTPTLGLTNVCCLEGNTVSGGTATWNGANTNMQLGMIWRG